MARAHVNSPANKKREDPDSNPRHNKHLQHSVLNEMVRLIQLEYPGSFWVPAADSVNIIYRGTTEHSSARCFLLHVYACLGNGSWLNLDCEPQFLLDLLEAFYKEAAESEDDVEQRIADLSAEEYF